MINVTGATGELGGLIVDALLESTAPGDLSVTVRSPEKAADLGERGVTVQTGDYDDLDALTKAFQGTDTLMFISGDAPVEARVGQHRRVVDAAVAAGVGRVIYTSFLDARPESPFTFSAVHADTEAYLRASGLEWTMLRPSAYAELTIGDAQRAAETGVLVSATGDAAVSFIGRADIARAAATALVGTGHAGATYKLTGPEALSRHDLAALVGQLSGREIVVQQIGLDEVATSLTSAGLPDFMVEALTGLQGAIAQGALAEVTDHAERLTCAPVRPLATHLSSAVTPR